MANYAALPIDMLVGTTRVWLPEKVLEVAELGFSAAAEHPESSPNATALLYCTGRLRDDCLVSLSQFTAKASLR